ncbi:S41 family peptidase [Rubrivirga sp. S365]|uniref:S41 family peptidase n=1 Tax=Rubrivirga litoralis TaxID=3075598 RepID=A0ABU3BLI5_9BACT|nr:MULTISPECIES: S41 family peptidase [unclassified Rubrivirga]MDT0630142.1 S41 family peptidase [Rubrivirga sp. F394]MDT7855653.1 S41 family peptidase [Rubrivirga sp. S365]
MTVRRLTPLLLLLALAPPAAAQAEGDLFAIRKSFGLFGSIYEALASEYVDAVDAERLMRTGIGAMTNALDPYTVYYDEATAAASRLQQQGEVGGVGVVLAERGGGLVVSSVLDGSDAEAQGLRPGDAVVSVAGQPGGAVSAERANALLRGDPGTSVPIEVEREGEAEPLRFVLVRAGEERSDVTYSGFVGDVAEGVGYVRLGRFMQEAAGQVTDAVEALQAQGELRALVLDLRGNPGGLLDQAVALSGVFLPEGAVVTATQGRSRGTDRTYTTGTAPLLPDLPVAVLVDGASASASEIVAGALQDHDRGVVVGETTYGKGLVQVVRPMPYGTALKLTVSRYTTPAGREIQRLSYAQGERAAAVPDSLRRAFQTRAGRTVRSGGGIEPDVPVSLGAESELERALVRSAAFLRFANRYAADHPALPDDFRVDGPVYDAFEAFVESEGVAYRTDAERAADALAADLDATGYSSAERPLADLRQAIEREKARDFERHAPRLQAQLRHEILSRYLGQRDQTVAELGRDPVLEAARRLLLDPAAYARTLGR